MKLPSVPSLSLVNHLNESYFDELWNATDDRGRANFQLDKITTRLSIGSVFVNLSVVGLPAAGKVYAVYQVPYRSFGRFIKLPPHRWITDSEVLDTQDIQLSTYAASGRLCPGGSVHLFYDPINSSVLVAVSYQYVLKCIGEVYPDLIMTVYKDTTRNTPIITELYTVNTNVVSTSTPAIINSAISAARTRYPNGTTVVIDGYVYSPANLPTLLNGSVVEIISDPDIVGYTDITVDDNITGYYSNEYGEYREVLHIAKSVNPQNVILTNDVVDVVIFDLVTGRGVYGHRADINALTSVTHNDFSMSRSVLQAFMNALESTSIVVRIYVRFPTSSIYLTDDVNHISDLYSLPDNLIQQQLTDNSSNQITEWSAAHLEQSAYLDLFYRFNGFNASLILQKFIEAIGYYEIAGTLAECIREYTYAGTVVEVAKPVRLYGIPCTAMVYSNGRKIPNSYINILDISNESFLISLDELYYVTVGSTITLYIIEDDTRLPVVFNPTVLAPSIVLNNDDYNLYLIENYIPPKLIWKDSAQKGYSLVDLNPLRYSVTENTDGTFTYTVRNSLLGKNYYLIPKYGMTTSEYMLDSIIDGQEPIILSLRVTNSQNQLIPLFGYTTVEVYINGYKLIEGMDYNIEILYGDNGDVLQTLLVVSNADYLDFVRPDNILEVVSHGDLIVSRDTGYAISNTLFRNSDLTLFDENCTRVFVHGRLLNNAAQSGNIITTTQTLEDGAPYVLEYTIPYGVRKLLKNFSPLSDNNLKLRIDNVLDLQPPVYPENIVVDRLYALYSPYLTQIINDVISGALIIRNEIAVPDFLAQFDSYLIIKDTDPTLGIANTLIDRRFVTLSVCYRNFYVADPQQMLMIRRLITLLHTPTPLTINEVLI